MSHAGDITPTEAYRALLADPDTVLVDCRTPVEWQHVGIPTLDGRPDGLVFVAWQPSLVGKVNPRFLDELADAGVGPDHIVYFLCRSGQRSAAAAAAATASGYRRAHNVTGGFEGPLGPDGRRGTAGWKVDGLPWRRR